VGSALGVGNYSQREVITRAISGGNFRHASRAREVSAGSPEIAVHKGAARRWSKSKCKKRRAKAIPAGFICMAVLSGASLPCRGIRQKGLDNMKQISTGAGLVALSVGMVATAFIVSQRGGSEAFAQGTGTERRIVSAGILQSGVPTTNSLQIYTSIWAYRIWSDNAIDMRCIGMGSNYPLGAGGGCSAALIAPTPGQPIANWTTVDNGTSGFRPLTDVDMSGTTDAGDISQVLMDFNTSSDDLPPPPIDCTINAPR
jgi:hypothetical protein